MSALFATNLEKEELSTTPRPKKRLKRNGRSRPKRSDPEGEESEQEDGDEEAIAPEAQERANDSHHDEADDTMKDHQEQQGGPPMDFNNVGTHDDGLTR